MAANLASPKLLLGTLPPSRGITYHLIAQQLRSCPISRCWIKYINHPLSVHNPFECYHRALITKELQHTEISKGLQPLNERITTIPTGTISSSNLSILCSKNYYLHHCSNGVSNHLIVSLEKLLNLICRDIYHLHLKQGETLVTIHWDRDSRILHWKKFYITIRVVKKIKLQHYTTFILT